MSHLTTDDLKAALVSLGVPLPSTDDDKEYLKLYKKHVGPLDNIEIKRKTKYNQLSSDDDDESSSDHVCTSTTKTTKSKIVTRMTENHFSESDIYSLSDEELYKELSSLNVTAGPIVDSTRKIYQRKLIKLMGGDVLDSSFNGNVDDEYSDSDSETHPKEDRNVHTEEVDKSSHLATQSSSTSTIRSRIAAGSYLPSALDNSLSFDHDRHTPSPRPSLRTASSSSSTTKYTIPGQTWRESTSVRRTYYPYQREQTPEATTSSLIVRFLVKCLFIVILLIAMYFTYQYLSSESPLKGLKHLAQQAVDLANGNTKEAKVKGKP